MPPGAGKAEGRGKSIGYKPIYNAAGEVVGFMEDYGEVALLHTGDKGGDI
jgi:hypothetical protein